MFLIVSIRMRSYCDLMAGGLNSFKTNEINRSRSFPSGHTSFSFAGATICALYSIYWLRRVRTSVRLNQDFPIPGQSLGIVVFFLFYVPAIWVAISRTQVKSSMFLDFYFNLGLPPLCHRYDSRGYYWHFQRLPVVYQLLRILTFAPAHVFENCTEKHCRD